MPQRSWCQWVSSCLSPSIYPLQHGRCWPHCQPSDSECRRSCHLWDKEMEWHWDMDRTRASGRKKQEQRKQKKNQHISRSFIFATFFNDSIWYQLSASQHQSLSHSRSRESHESCSWTSQYSGGVLLWSLDTVGACQVAVSRATVRSRTAAADVKHSHLFNSSIRVNKETKDEYVFSKQNLQTDTSWSGHSDISLRVLFRPLLWDKWWSQPSGLLCLNRQQNVTELWDNRKAVNSPALSLTKRTPHQPWLFLLSYWQRHTDGTAAEKRK